MITLPFVYTNKSISDWLSQFPASDFLLLSKEVFNVLSTLKKHHDKIDSGSLSIVINRLTPVVLHLSTTLRKAIINHSQGNKVAVLSIRTLYHLAFLHVHLARKVKLQRDKVMHINHALQLLGIAFLQSALAYQRPSVVLWDCLGEVYVLAKHENLLEMSVNHSIIEFQELITSSMALKRVLLFWLITPYRFNQRDILTLFDFCTKNCSFVNIMQSVTSSDHVFCWEYKSVANIQPVYRHADQVSDPCVLFSTDALINFEHKQAVTIGAANIVMAALDQYQLLLESTKFTLASSYVFVSCFNSAVDFFIKHVRQYRILILNTPSPNDLNFTSLAMVNEHLQNDSKLDKVASSDIWRYQQEVVEDESPKLKFGAMKLVQTSLPLFFVVETMAVQLKVGDIFICYDSALKPAIGIVRRVQSGRKGAVQNSVVELFQGKVRLLQQTLQAVNTKLSALLLENGDDKQLFIVSAHYEAGNVLKFDQQAVVLDRLIEITPHIMRYKVRCIAL